MQNQISYILSFFRRALVDHFVNPLRFLSLDCRICLMLTGLLCFFSASHLRAQDDEASNIIRQLLGNTVKQDQTTIEPIKIPANSITFKEVDALQKEWYQRIWIKPALERMNRREDALWKKDAEEFLNQALPWIFSDRIKVPSYELAEKGRKLIDAGCEDPAVLILAALVDRWVVSDWRFVTKCATTAIKHMDKDPEAKAVMVYYANHLWISSSRLSGLDKRDGIKINTALENYRKAAIRMASDGSFSNNESGLFIYHYLMIEREPGMNEDMIREAQNLPLPDWARKTLMGISYVDIAWSARGNGWANTVANEEWKSFGKNLQKARAELVEAWRLNPKSPYAAWKMIAVVMAGYGENDDSLQLWFERCVAAQCDYRNAYAAMLWAYRPRWCGSHEKMLEFGKACADTKRYDLDIPIYFMRACNDIIKETGDWRAFYNRPDVAKVLIEVSEGLVREPSRIQEKPMRLSFLALNSWLVGDNKRAALALKELDGPLHPEAVGKLSMLRMSESELREEVALSQSPVASDYKKAKELFEAGKISDAELILRRIQPKSPQDVQASVTELIDLCDIEKRLEKGEWVTLNAKPGLRGWINRGGNWSGTAEGKLVNHGHDGQGFIVHRARIGPNFEMRVEYSVEAKANCCKHCSIVFGSYAGFEDPFNVAFHGQNGKSKGMAYVSYRCLEEGEKIKSVKSKLKDNNVMLIRAKDEKITYTANDEVIYQEIENQNIDFGTDDARVGIGSFRWCRMNVTNISKIEVRRLTEE